METLGIKDILVTTDLSQDSEKAYPLARSLAERYSAKLTIVTCIDSSMQYAHAGAAGLEIPSMYSSAHAADISASTARVLDEQVAEHFPGMTLDQRVLQAAAPIEHTLVAFSSENRFDLVVLASHGRTGFTRALIGSVAEYVLRHSHCPVLVVPTKG